MHRRTKSLACDIKSLTFRLGWPTVGQERPDEYELLYAVNRIVWSRVLNVLGQLIVRQSCRFRRTKSSKMSMSIVFRRHKHNALVIDENDYMYNLINGLAASSSVLHSGHVLREIMLETQSPQNERCPQGTAVCVRAPTKQMTHVLS